MYFNHVVLWIFCSICCSTLASRDIYETKCTRGCSTTQGSLDCWKATTDGFTYGLSSAMVDFCRIVLKLRNLTDSENWHRIAGDMLNKHINDYEIDSDVRQISRDDMKLVATSLLDRCFNASTTTTASEPTCSSCPDSENTRIKQWQISTIALISFAGALTIILFVLHFLQAHRTNRSYVSL